jgi:RsiW-degrading membrane proteinase PrsW (M82 family)
MKLRRRHLLQRLGSDVALLAKAAAAVVVIGMLLAWLVAVPPQAGLFPDSGDPGHAFKMTSREDIPKLLDSIRFLSSAHREAEGSEDPVELQRPDPGRPALAGFAVDSPGLADAEVNLLTDYLKAFRQGRPPREMTAMFLARATRIPPSADQALAAAVAGDVLRHAGEYEAALQRYDEGAAMEGACAVYCRRRALELCADKGWKDRLRSRYQRPAWPEALAQESPFAETDRIIVAAGDWRGLLRHAWSHFCRGLARPQWLVLTLVMAAVWLVTIGLVCGIRRADWLLCWLALVTGALGVVPVLVMAVLQNRLSSLQENGTALNDLIFYVSGVGLREELGKLIAFLPLLLFLRRATPGTCFAVASCCGLGFAVAENLSYLSASMGLAALPRFLTANFLHLALTGLCGGYLCLAIRWSRSFFHQFSTVLLGSVLAHGIYDWSISGASGPEGSAIHFFCFLAIAWHYFQTLHRFSDRSASDAQPEAIWVMGVAFLSAALMIVTARQSGFASAMDAVIPTAGSLFATAALMIWKIRHS